MRRRRAVAASSGQPYIARTPNGHENVLSCLLVVFMAGGDDVRAEVVTHPALDSATGASMIRWKLCIAAGVVAVALAVFMSPASGAASHVTRHPAAGVGSCTLKGWDPNDPNEANSPIGDRRQTYKPDNYNCTGARFAKPGVEFARSPQPKDFHIPAGKTIPRTLPLAGKCLAGECS